MLFNPLFCRIAASLPLGLEGRVLHRLGLASLHAGRWREADALFDRAATRYRREIEVEALARLRAHQGIARLRALEVQDPQQVLEVERRLYRLRTIEALEPPFALIDAGRLLAAWTGHSPTRAPLELRVVQPPRRA
jgi:hypothetical protein